jgi:hypothetical protein
MVFPLSNTLSFVLFVRPTVHANWRIAAASVSLALLVASPRISAQADSIFTISPRVGRYIDAPEREYFGIFPGVPDSDRVILLRTVTDTGNVFVVTSTLGNLKPTPIGQDEVMELAGHIDSLEEIRALENNIRFYGTVDQGEGRDVVIELRTKKRLWGELLFADVHGVVVRTSDNEAIPASNIRSISLTHLFGNGALYGLGSGVLLGALLCGVSGVSGGGPEAGFGVFVTMIFGSAGAVVGIVFDVIREGIGDSKIYGNELPWNTSAIRRISAECRYPLGTPKMKQLLAGVDNE